jgi:hypothetical protein
MPLIAKAQATLYGWIQTHLIADNGNRAKVQQEVYQNTGYTFTI